MDIIENINTFGQNVNKPQRLRPLFKKSLEGKIMLKQTKKLPKRK